PEGRPEVGNQDTAQWFASGQERERARRRKIPAGPGQSYASAAPAAGHRKTIIPPLNDEAPQRRAAGQSHAFGYAETGQAAAFNCCVYGIAGIGYLTVELGQLVGNRP